MTPAKTAEVLVVSCSVAHVHPVRGDVRKVFELGASPVLARIVDDEQLPANSLLRGQGFQDSVETPR